MNKEPEIKIKRGHPKQEFPPFKWILKTPNRFFAFGAGSGLLRPAPGTWGTLLAWLLWYPIQYLFQGNEIALAIFLLIAFVYGVFATQRVSREMGVHDHGGIVFDEWVATWLVLFLLVTPSVNPLWQVVGVVLFRILDIFKPWPIRFFDRRIKGGIGIMLDDIVAALLSLFVTALLIRIVGIWF